MGLKKKKGETTSEACCRPRSPVREKQVERRWAGNMGSAESDLTEEPCLLSSLNWCSPANGLLMPRCTQRIRSSVLAAFVRDDHRTLRAWRESRTKILHPVLATLRLCIAAVLIEKICALHQLLNIWTSNQHTVWALPSSSILFNIFSEEEGTCISSALNYSVSLNNKRCRSCARSKWEAAAEQ
jgi:hypothetical protein